MSEEQPKDLKADANLEELDEELYVDELKDVAGGGIPLPPEGVRAVGLYLHDAPTVFIPPDSQGSSGSQRSSGLYSGNSLATPPKISTPTPNLKFKMPV